MIISKLEVKDFGPFQGVNTFDFQINDPNKNIILIGGKNGSGKTTLFTAIKLALYGHLTFGYKSSHRIYLNKVKKYINSKSLSKTNSITYTCITLSLPNDRQLCEYVIKRDWKYVNSELVENLSVKMNGQKLNNIEISDFMNYLIGIIPPKLFDFFFFDGENITDFFIEKNYNKNLKDALLTLCNLDSFEIIKKYVGGYKNKNLQGINSAENHKEYNNLKNKYNEQLRKKEFLKSRISVINEKLEELMLNKLETEKEFRKLGGLMVDERDRLIKKINSLEKQREDKHIWLKNFANTLLPFLITRKTIKNIRTQIEKEEQFKNYKIITEKINKNFLEEIIKNKLISSTNTTMSIPLNELAVTLTKDIHESLKPNFNINNFKILHSLSQDEKNQILRIIHEVEQINLNVVEQTFSEIENITAKIKKINEKLKVNDKNTELSSYIKKINKLNSNINELVIEKENLQNELNFLEENIMNTESLLDRSYEKLIKHTKNRHAVELCTSIEKMVNVFLKNVIKDKIKDIKTNFMSILNQLIRKENFIDDIDITDELEITICRQEVLSINELLNIFENIGVSKITSQLGKKCIDSLKVHLNVNKLDEIEKKLNTLPKDKTLLLPIKVEINNLSKGEQQIYIISLYWALSKLSKYNIPFIIDTPYARIDSSHRDNITIKFLPQLGRQVIILSTDEEINQEYYKKLKPYLAHEYLITYDDKENKTFLDKKYFFEVK